MEDMGNVCPFVQILDLLVPQMVGTVLEFFRLLDLPDDEHVIEAPKVSSSSCFSRRHRWWNSWWKCRRFCPMPCSSSVTWSKSLTCQFLIVVVVEVFKVSLPDMVPDSVLSSRTWSFQFLTLVVPTEVPQDSVLWNRPLTFQFPVFKALLQDTVQELVVELMSVVEVARALSQDRVQQRLVKLSLVLAVKVVASLGAFGCCL